MAKIKLSMRVKLNGFRLEGIKDKIEITILSPKRNIQKIKINLKSNLQKRRNKYIMLKGNKNIFLRIKIKIR